jgi:RimJ/RimL family protein N-acetyltransferase
MDFKLRKWETSDASALAQYANNPKIANQLTDGFPHPYTIDNAKKFIEMARSHDPQQIFAIEINGEACGGIGLHPKDDIMVKNAELGYWLAEPYWGNGVVSRAIEQIVEYGFNTFDITRIYARPFGTNLASQRVLQKAGFELEARFKKTVYKNGRFEDELYYAVRKT